VTQPNPPTEAPQAGLAPDSTERVRRESVLYLPGKLIRALTGALIYPILAVAFAAEEVGRYDLSIRFVDFLYTLCALWLGTVIVRYYSAFHERNEKPAYLNVVGLIRLAGVGVGLGLLLMPRLLAPAPYHPLLSAAALMFIGYTLFETGLMMLRAKSKAVAYSACTATAAVGRVVVGLLLALGLGMGVKGMIWGVAIMHLALYFTVMRPHFASLRLRLTDSERAFLREALVFGLPLGLSALLTFFLGNADRYLLRIFRGDAEVGLFAVASQFGEQPVFVLYSSIMLAVFPAAARVFDRDGRRAAEAFNRSTTRNYLFLAAPIVVLLGVLSKPFLGMFPREYAMTYPVMPWVAAGAFLHGLAQYPGMGLLITKRTPLMLGVNAIAVAVNLTVGCVLIPRLGFIGCGVTRVISGCVLVVVMALATRRCLAWSIPMLSVVRVGAAAAITGLAVHAGYSLLPAQMAIPLTLCALTLASCAGIVLFATLLLLLREIRFRNLVDGIRGLIRRAR